MAVTAIGPVLPVPAIANGNPLPDAADAASFEHTLAQASASAPASGALDVIHELSVNYDQAIASVPTAAQGASDPQAMVNAQSNLMQSMTSIDILAKGLGSVSQSVNRLLTMQ